MKKYFLWYHNKHIRLMTSCVSEFHQLVCVKVMICVLSAIRNIKDMNLSWFIYDCIYVPSCCQYCYISEWHICGLVNKDTISDNVLLPILHNTSIWTSASSLLNAHHKFNNLCLWIWKCLQNGGNFASALMSVEWGGGGGGGGVGDKSTCCPGSRIAWALSLLVRNSSEAGWRHYVVSRSS